MLPSPPRGLYHGRVSCRPAWRVLWLIITTFICQCACAASVSISGLAQLYFPQSDRLGEFDGEPPAAPVYRGDRLLGYVLRTTDIVRIPAYSGEPITLLVGVDLTGRITGLDILEHSEPILVVGISEQDLARYAAQYKGLSVLEKVKLGGAAREGYATIDGITGATITAMVMNATVMKSARLVADSRGIPYIRADPETGQVAVPQVAVPVRVSDQPTPVWWLGETSEPFWVNVWRERWWQVAILCAALGVLTFILFFPGLADAAADAVEISAYRFSRLYPGLYRLVHAGPAVGNPCPDLYQCHPAPVQLGIIPGRSADFYSLGLCGADTAVVGARRVLRLAVSRSVPCRN